MNDIIELYIEGLSIEEISEDMKISEDEILGVLRSYKKKDENGKDYIYILKEMIVERVLSGVKRGDIAKELGVAYRTINKYLQEFNVETPKGKSSEDRDMFTEIDWDRFDMCPDCKGTVGVSDLNIYHDEKTRNSYCLDCGTEWLQKGNVVYKVLWEFVR